MAQICQIMIGDTHGAAFRQTIEINPVYLSDSQRKTGFKRVNSHYRSLLDLSTYQELDHTFNWAPDLSGIGYIADQDTNDVDELYASQPDGSENTLLSGILTAGGDVLSFDWIP